MGFVRSQVYKDATWQRAWICDNYSDLATIASENLPRHGDFAYVSYYESWFLWTDDNNWQSIGISNYYYTYYPNSVLYGDSTNPVIMSNYGFFFFPPGSNEGPSVAIGDNTNLTGLQDKLNIYPDANGQGLSLYSYPYPSDPSYSVTQLGITARVYTGASAGGIIFTNDEGAENCTILFYSRDGGNIMFFDANGNVGIGTITPTAQLHTTGTVRFANFSDGLLAVDGSGNVYVSSGGGLDYVELSDGVSGTAPPSIIHDGYGNFIQIPYAA